MKLEPGYYRVQKKGYEEAYGKKHPRTNTNAFQILRVERTKEGIKCYLNQDTFGHDPSQLEDYEIESRFEREPVITNPRIILSFRDQKGIEYNWEVRDMWVLRAVFDWMPWLRKPFGFVPRKK